MHVNHCGNISERFIMILQKISYMVSYLFKCKLKRQQLKRKRAKIKKKK